MKKIILSIAGMFITYQLNAQSCCMRSAQGNFALASSDQKFVSSHLPPEPFTYTPHGGFKISYPTPDGKTASAFHFKGHGVAKNYIFVFHEWWGLNDYIKLEAEKIYTDFGHNVNVIALDLYDGRTTSSPDTAQNYLKSLNEERARAIISGALSYIGKDASIGTIGWCMGGTWSLQASLLAGEQSKACVMYYGFPEMSDKLKALKAPVLGIFAKQDGWISTKVVDDFEKKMKEENKAITIKMYDADHAFANPSNPKHNKEASADAYKLATGFLRENLK